MPTTNQEKGTIMQSIADVHYQRQIIAERHEALRRDAGASRLRRSVRRERRRQRAGPDR